VVAEKKIAKRKRNWRLQNNNREKRELRENFYRKDAKSRSDKRKLASYEVAGVSGKNKIRPARDDGIVRFIAVAK
jgi:hypothetical protein